MGFLLSEILIIVSIGKVMMSFYGNVCCSTLTISILMKYISFWSLYLKSVSTLILFLVYVAIFNHLSASGMKILN